MDHNFLVRFLSLPSLTPLHHLTLWLLRTVEKTLHNYSIEIVTVPNEGAEKRRLKQMEYRHKQGQ